MVRSNITVVIQCKFQQWKSSQLGLFDGTPYLHSVAQAKFSGMP